MDEDMVSESGTEVLLVDPCPGGHTDLLDAIGAQFDREHRQEFDRPELWQHTDRQLLAEVEAAQRKLARVQGYWLDLLAEAEKREATRRLTGLPTVSWLTDRNSHSARTAREEVRLAVRLAEQPVVARALRTGELSLEQAGAIAHGVSRLPDDLDSGQREQVAQHLVELGQRFGPAGLARLSNRAVEAVAPEVAEDADRRAVERAEARQRRERYLTWRSGPDGALMLSGSLPRVAGEKLVGLLAAVGANLRKTAALAGVHLTRAQAQADALERIVDHYGGCQELPKLGADRPRILVQVDHEVLCGRLGTATLLNTGELVSAHQTRILACDAGILPAVMGAGSVPLDVGRKRRLFGSTLRALLVARDQGCSFPGCDAKPAECDGHHIIPWHAGGATSLTNGILICAFHHHLVEPDPNHPPGTQWQVRLDHHGMPEFGAPEGRGAPAGQRRWRQHHKYRLRL